jgi:hypothetical protein
MADTRVIDLDTGVVVEMRGHGRPHGSKNKPKGVIYTSKTYLLSQTLLLLFLL